MATLVAGLLLAAVSAVAAIYFQPKDELFDPATGYRVKNMRTPVTSALIGGKVINLDSLEKLIADGNPVMIDVMYIEHGLRSRMTMGYLGQNPLRRHIPGSLWFPVLGQGLMSHEDDEMHRKALSRITGGDMTRPIVFYCLSECWASWNAARRAIAYGHRNVLWFKEGTDLWNDAGLEMEVAIPYFDDINSREK